MGLEGIVSKRKDSPYRSGRSPDWLKSKNPACEAVRREEEEDWGGDCSQQDRHHQDELTPSRFETAWTFSFLRSSVVGAKATCESITRVGTLGQNGTATPATTVRDSTISRPITARRS